MSWTRNGTVSLINGSAVVYGASTAWAALCRPGDTFIAPGGALYEVLSVQSNTQLTLTSSYLGATAGAQSYALIHTGLLPAELAVGISELQSKYLTTIAQLYEWETSVAATVPLTNPGTGVTSNVKPIAGLIADIGTKAPLANPVFSGGVSVGTGTGSPVVSAHGGVGPGEGGSFRLHSAGLLIGALVPESAWSGSGTSTNTVLASFGTRSLSLATGGVIRQTVDAAGNVLVTSPALLGYGTNAGGTVTQATSNYTSVAINKPSGRIITSGVALAAGEIAYFVCNNNLISATDHITCFVNNNSAALEVKAIHVAYQLIVFLVTNTSGYPYASAINICFQAYKGAA